MWKIPVKSPPYVMLSSDYSQQEPKITAFVSKDPNMLKAFKDRKDIYATIASLAFNLPYEKCLEFHPDTHEYQPDGKARRGEAKTIVLGITYGRSVTTIADQLFGKNEKMSDEDKIKAAQKIYDAVLNAFPNLRSFMIQAQKTATRKGYVETILGRRRHIPDMQLPKFEFYPMSGYVNPDIDPMDISTLQNKNKIPERIVKALNDEFNSYKYYGQIARRTRELYEQKIRVVNNSSKIADASRRCVNCVDLETEILTDHGWKHYGEINKGDIIYSYDLSKRKITLDIILDIHIYDEDIETVEFDSPTFYSVSTLNHRWVVCNSGEAPRIKTTSDIVRHKWPDYPILRVSDNDIVSKCTYSDDMLKLIGWILTDGCFSKQSYGIVLYQSTRRQKNIDVYNSIISVLNRLGIKYTDAVYDNNYHEIYLHKCEITSKILEEFPDRELTYRFISTLCQSQAQIVMWSMIEGDGTLGENGSNITLCCSSKGKADMFQYLAFIAGYATNSYEYTPEMCNSYPSSDKIYESTGNINPIKITKSYYIVSVLRLVRAQIYPHHKHNIISRGVWCPTTTNGTWVARRSGKVFITGNSVVQGSAAEMTKIAILLLENNEDWKKLGGRLLVPVHDELIAEVPIDSWEEGGQLLSKLMSEAGNFLPFPIDCDVETSLRWYGLSYPCPYIKPKSLIDNTQEEVKWIQYHLHELEYDLPIFNDKNGEKPRGDAALGINGVESEQYLLDIKDYRNRYDLQTDEDFVNHIENKVIRGV